MEKQLARIKKIDDERQIVFAEVYAPNLPDTQGDFMDPEDIRLGAYGFLASGRVQNVDLNHDNKRTGSVVVESFIAREGDPDFILDSWVVAILIPDPELWQAVKSQKINGLSFEGFVQAKVETLEIEIPDQVNGVTKIAGAEPHDHKYVVRFNDQGEFIGGEAQPGEGPGSDHSHPILKPTLTEDGGPDPHKHRFSFLDEIVRLQKEAADGQRQAET